MIVVRKFVAWLVVWCYGVSIDFALQAADRVVDARAYVEKLHEHVKALEVAHAKALEDVKTSRRVADCMTVKADSYEASLRAISGAVRVPLGYATQIAERALRENRAS